MGAAADRGDRPILRRRRGERVDRLSRDRDRRRVALEERQPEVLGGAASVVERRLRCARVAVVVMMVVAARTAVIVVVRLAVDRPSPSVTVPVGLAAPAAVDDDLAERPVREQTGPLLAASVLALLRLAVVDQGVEPGDHGPGKRHRGQARSRAPRPPALFPVLSHPELATDIRRSPPVGLLDPADLDTRRGRPGIDRLFSPRHRPLARNASAVTNRSRWPRVAAAPGTFRSTQPCRRGRRPPL